MQKICKTNEYWLQCWKCGTWYLDGEYECGVCRSILRMPQKKLVK